jgi:hypothetical protein
MKLSGNHQLAPLRPIHNPHQSILTQGSAATANFGGGL